LRGEESATGAREVDGGVCEFPAGAGGGVDFAAEQAADDLVAEADAGEFDVGAFGPDVCGWKEM